MTSTLLDKPVFCERREKANYPNTQEFQFQFFQQFLNNDEFSSL